MKIFILGFRVAGLDGVSLESVHWKKILENLGHQVTLVAGELDREGIVIPELHFKSPKVVGIHNRVIYGDESYEKVERAVFSLAGDLEGILRRLFRANGGVDLVIAPNVFSLPIHFPLSIALARVINEFSIKTIARHHDFWWERERYDKSKMFDFYKKWFPPILPEISHTVINSDAQNQFKKRFGIDAPIISDTFDFEDTKLNKLDHFSKNFRNAFDINEDDIVFLQATRIVPRKRVELSIELLSKLQNPKALLLVTGTEGDEKPGYLSYLKKYARDKNIRARFVGERIDSVRRIEKGHKIFTLWDAYVNSDFVTYPTELEGFGNQFVESMYFRRPIILTPYDIYKSDIKPLGFNVIEMDEKISDSVTEKIKDLIQNKDEVEKMTEYNFNLGKKCFSYDETSKKIQKLLDA